MREYVAGDISGTEWSSSYVDPETQMIHFREEQFHNLTIRVAPVSNAI